MPHGVDPDQALPFAVMMHGGGGTSMRMEFTVPLAEEYGVVLLLPNSRTFTWDAVVGPFGADATFLDGALAQVFSSCALDPARVTLGGLSDAATYALALGLLNGDLFTQLVAFSPGFLKPVDRHGRPRVFVSHGTRDTVLNINVGGRGIVRQLTDEGYDATYREFDGGRLTPASEARRDNFRDPDGKLSNSTAPLLLTEVDNRQPFTLTAKVTPTFLKTYDASARLRPAGLDGSSGIRLPPMARLRRLKTTLVVVASLALLLVAFVVLTALTAPGRRGLAGAEARASAWRSLPPLRELADRAGVRFGTAVMVRDMRGDPRYSPLLAREFNSVTPFVEMKWGTIHPERDRYDFSQADELVAFAVAHHMRVRGHALVYGQVVDPPNPAYLAQTTDPAALRALMASHIGAVMKRYAGRVDAWDVVNEPLAWKGSAEQAEGLAEHVFSRTLGPGYVGEALRIAREADPSAQLFVNEFGTLEPGPRQERCFRLVQRLLQEGAPLDAVGFQGHVVPLLGGAGPTRAQIEATLRRFAALGVAVEITELNVFTRTLRHILTLGLTYDETAELERQALAYADAVQACLDVPACQGVTVWTFTDRYPTTIETKTHLEDIPLLFDDEYRPKPAAFAVREALARATPRQVRDAPTTAPRP